LLVATESVGDDERIVGCLAHRGKQLLFSAGLRHVVMLAALESERSRHAAAAVLGDFDVESHLFEQRSLPLESNDRPVMAMGMDNRPPVDSGRIEVVLLVQKLAQRASRLLEPLSILIVWE
jgi:hypothetical protein